MLPSSLLKRYMERFFGYGNLNADTWFIGMEEGGGNSEQNILQRLIRWNTLGAGTVVDNLRFHEAVQDAKGENLSYLFDANAKIQRTWAGLIRIWLATQDKSDDSANAVRAVQSTSWGRIEANNCLLELLPLPSPGVNRWYYDQWTDLDILRTRESYKAAMSSMRTHKLGALISAHRPRCAVFYSVSADYMTRWSEIAGVDFNTIEPELMCTGNQGQAFTARFHKNGPTLYAVIYHPVYTGLTKAYFRQVGLAIKERS